jgi:hypothetical protein
LAQFLRKSPIHGDNPFITVAQCLAKYGFPLAKNPDKPGNGGVYSLYPPNKPPYPYGPPALQKSNLLGPNIADADWRAISSVAPANSDLEYLLNNLISAIYPQNVPKKCPATGTAPTINQILADPNNPNNPSNDAIVTVSSQLWGGGIQADHAYAFQGLSHAGLPAIAAAILPPGLSDANVPESPGVWQLVCSLLSPSTTCPAAVPASSTPVSASNASAVNKNAVLLASLPSRPPPQFHADTFPVTAIPLDRDNPTLRLQPWAIYANVAGRVYLDTSDVSYSIAPSVGPPVVSLDLNGVVHGLRTGTATIIARFGSLTDQVRVSVETEQQ